MTSARDVIRLVIEDIDSEINMLRSSLRYAEAKGKINKDSKNMAMASGVDFLIASERYDFSIGFHAGLESECKDRITALIRKREYYELLDKQYAEEEGNE